MKIFDPSKLTPFDLNWIDMVVSFQLSKVKSLYDEFIRIKLYGITNMHKITLLSSYKNKRSVFAAHACYHTIDNSDILDLAHSRSVGGSYVGIEPMGLFWSMKPTAEYKGFPYANYSSTAAEKHLISLQAHAGHLHHPSDFSTETLLCETTAERGHLAEHVERIEVNTGRLRGTFFRPRGYTSCPGVLDLSGATGGLYEDRAALLAAKGYATLALAYFGYGDLPPQLLEEDLDYFEEGIDWLMEQPGVHKTGVGVFGRSKGADIALHLACYLPKEKVRAAFCLCPLAYITAWPVRYKGKIVHEPFGYKLEDGEQTTRGFVGTEINTTRVGLEHVVPVEQSEAQLVFSVPGDDGLVPENTAHLLAERMTRAGKTNFEVIRDPGAGHMIDHPFTPSSQQLKSKVFKTLICAGGTSKDNNVAQLKLWLRLQSFFTRHVGAPISAF